MGCIDGTGKRYGSMSGIIVWVALVIIGDVSGMGGIYGMECIQVTGAMGGLVGRDNIGDMTRCNRNNYFI